MYIDSLKGTKITSDGDFKKKLEVLPISSSLTGLNEEIHLNIVHIYTLDDTKRTFSVTESATVQNLIYQIAEKLEISDCDFFGIVDVSDNPGTHFIILNLYLFLERWLNLDIPILQQSIDSTSKLFFKVRVLYRDASELTDPAAIYLYYLQVKKVMLAEKINVLGKKVCFELFIKLVRK
jgi:hypothetical protein